jgi:hypothetical protein
MWYRALVWPILIHVVAPDAIPNGGVEEEGLTLIDPSENTQENHNRWSKFTFVGKKQKDPKGRHIYDPEKYYSTAPTTAPTKMDQDTKAREAHEWAIHAEQAKERSLTRRINNTRVHLKQVQEELAKDKVFRSKLKTIAEAGKSLGYTNNGWTPPLKARKKELDHKIHGLSHNIQMTSQQLQYLTRTRSPTDMPTSAPTKTILPTSVPTSVPSTTPTVCPTNSPTPSPTACPTSKPSFEDLQNSGILEGDDDAMGAKGHGTLQDDDLGGDST